MLNQTVLVGRINEDIVLKETNNGFKFATLLLEVERPYNNKEVENDLFQITLWRNVAEDCINVCKKGTLIGVKGRLQSNNYVKDDGSTLYRFEIIAEKLTVLTNK